MRFSAFNIQSVLCIHFNFPPFRGCHVCLLYIVHHQCTLLPWNLIICTKTSSTCSIKADCLWFSSCKYSSHKYKRMYLYHSRLLQQGMPLARNIAATNVQNTQKVSTISIYKITCIFNGLSLTGSRSLVCC